VGSDRSAVARPLFGVSDRGVGAWIGGDSGGEGSCGAAGDGSRERPKTVGMAAVFAAVALTGGPSGYSGELALAR
jgi:hypothetical protein